MLAKAPLSPHPDIRPGDIWRFTCGDCHVLAARLHKITGWPIHCGYDHEFPDVHAFVLTPDGMALDVRGPMKPSACLRGYNYRKGHREFSWAEIRRAWITPSLGAYSYERARKIAPVLVELARA